MPTVAERLRQAREAQNLSVYDVAEITKIKTDHIRALEDGSYDVFAAPVYIRGFVRCYAGVLRLDVSQTLADLEAELARDERFREPPSLSRDPLGPLDRLMFQLSKVRWRAVWPWLAALALLVVILGGVSIWKSRRVNDPLSRLGPGLYQSPSPQGELLPLPTNSPAR